MKIKVWALLYVISFVVLAAGLTVITFGAIKKDTALAISGIGLVGSFVGMYASATNTKSQYEKDRPFIVLKINEDRYSIMQLELYNAGKNAAIIKKISLDKELPIISGGTLQSNAKDAIIQGLGSIKYPYTIYGNEKFNDRYVNITGYVKYRDLSGELFSNKIRLNMTNLTEELANKNESIKRDYYMTQFHNYFFNKIKELQNSQKYFLKLI